MKAFLREAVRRLRKLYSPPASPPIWQETVSLAQRTLAQFADFELNQWRVLGRPAW